MRITKNQKYIALVEAIDGNTIKINKAQKLTGVNQFSKYWKTISARNFSRALNNSNIVIK